jgi:hypothetical protein
MTSLFHNFFVSERDIYLWREIDSSGKTGGGFLVFVEATMVRRTRRARAERMSAQPLKTDEARLVMP